MPPVKGKLAGLNKPANQGLIFSRFYLILPKFLAAASNMIVQTTETRDAPKNRRTVILAALKRCMVEKGYAETSLTDLAKSADMSVSHLLYYYPSKDAVLNELFDKIYERILADVTADRDEPTERRIRLLAKNVFIPGAVNTSELGIIQEIIALAGHRPELRNRLSRLSAEMTAYLEDLFSKTPRQHGLSALDAAEIAGALWMGLMNNTGYDSRLDTAQARRLFRSTLMALAGLKGFF